MTHRGPFQPLLFCDSVILSPSVRPGAGGVDFLGSRAVGSAFLGLSYFQMNQSRGVLVRDGVSVAATPFLGAATAELHECTEGLQPPRSPAGLGWPKGGSRLCSMGRGESFLLGDNVWDREVQAGEPGLVTSLLQYSCVLTGFPFPLAPWVLSSQTDGLGPHVCCAAAMILVFIPIPSSARGPGF